MEIILLVLIIGYLFFKNTTARGLRTVRAFVFLSSIDRQENIDDANDSALYFNEENVDIYMVSSAKNYCRDIYGGKQLAMINHARSKGFIG